MSLRAKRFPGTYSSVDWSLPYTVVELNPLNEGASTLRFIINCTNQTSARLEHHEKPCCPFPRYCCCSNLMFHTSGIQFRLSNTHKLAGRSMAPSECAGRVFQLSVDSHGQHHSNVSAYYNLAPGTMSLSTNRCQTTFGTCLAAQLPSGRATLQAHFRQ